MKIAMVCADDLPAGSRARREARALAAAGHVVTVHGALGEGGEPEEDDGDVVLVRVPVARWERARGGLAGVLGAAQYFERCAPVVRAAMTRSPPEAVHAVGLDTAASARDAARRAGVPFVFEECEGGAASLSDEAAQPGGAALRDALRAVRRRAASLEARVRGAATACVATSEQLAADAQRRFGGETPVVVRECPPLRDARPSELLRVRLGVHPADRIVVFHGPPDRAHGVEAAIRAMRVLGEHVVLVVLGAAWCQDRLLGLAAEQGVLPQVRVASTGPSDDVVALLASAEAAVLPLSSADRSTRLGLPAALGECLMAGLPVVVSDVPESGALVRRAGAGVVVPAAPEVRPNDVADGVRTLLTDPDLRRSCAGAARRVATEELHWERESQRLVDLYDRISSSL